jgi:hypothetical protein
MLISYRFAISLSGSEARIAGWDGSRGLGQVVKVMAAGE